MKVPTYKQETARTRETGSRNFSAQVSGRDLAAPFEAQAEAFGQLANQSLDFMSAQLKRERDSQENDEQNAYIEERARVLQVIDETPVGQTFPDLFFPETSISGKGDAITFNSESDAERFFEQSMQRFKANRGFQFANKQREDSFTSRIERNDILIKSKLVTNSRERVVAKAFASFSNNLDTLANDVLQQARDLPVYSVYDFPSGDEEGVFVFALNNPQIQAQFNEISEKIDRGVASGFFSKEKAIELKAKTKKDLSLNILKDQINRATSIESLEFMQQQIEKLQTSDISTQDRIDLLDVTEEDIDAFRAAETAEEKAELAKRKGLSTDLALQLTEELEKNPGDAETIRALLVDGALDEQLLPSDRITLLRLVNSKMNEVSQADKAKIESLRQISKSVINLVRQGGDIDVPRVEQIRSDLMAVGEKEEAQKLNLLLEVVDRNKSVEGQSMARISEEIENVQTEEASVMFPYSSREQAEEFKQLLINSLRERRSEASKFFQNKFHLDYFAKYNDVPSILDGNVTQNVSSRIDLMDQVAQKFFSGSTSNFADLQKSLNPLTESELKAISNYLESDDALPAEKAQLLISLNPLFTEYPTTRIKLSETKADAYVLISTLPPSVAADAIEGLNQKKTFSQITVNSIKDQVKEIIGTTYSHIRDSAREQSTNEKVVVALVRGLAPSGIEEDQLTNIVEVAINQVTGGIGTRADSNFELPPKMFNEDGIEVTDVDEKKELMEILFENFTPEMILYLAPDGLFVSSEKRDPKSKGRSKDNSKNPQILEQVARDIRNEKFAPISVNNNTIAFKKDNETIIVQADGKTEFAIKWDRGLEQILYQTLQKRDDATALNFRKTAQKIQEMEKN